MMRRTPMKRTQFKRAAPSAKSQSNQAKALASKALIAIKAIAPLRAGTYAAPTALAAAIPKAAPVRSEKYRRAVASLPCVICGVPGYSQAAHGSEGKGMALKACDLTLFPACCDRPGVQGCHSKLDQGALFTKAARRELEPAWAADTQRRIQALGLWPKNMQKPAQALCQ